jgi:FG-GAP-like repeat/Bacterial pre-peptidase C-terminal domain
MSRRPIKKRRKHFGCEWLEARRLLTGHDTLATAIPATLASGVPGMFAGNISDPAIPDLYQFNLAVGEHLAANVDVQSLGSSLQSYLRVFNSTGTERVNSGGGSGDSAATYAAIANGTYYVGVSDSVNSSYNPNTSGGGFGFTSGQYNLTLLVTPPVSDANDSLAHATTISFVRSVPASASGAIAFPRDADLFKLSLNNGDTANLAIDALSIGSPLDSRLRVFDSAGNELAANHTPGSDATLSFHATTGGVYYVGVSGGDNATYDPSVPQSGTDASVGSFHLNVTVNSPPVVTQEVEPNGTFDDANSIALGTSVGGTVAAGDKDFYLFTLTSAGQLTVAAAADPLSSLATRLTLFSSDRQPLLSADGLPGGPAASIQQHLAAGTYYVSVSSAAASGAAISGDYHLSTSFIAATPPFSDVPADQNTVAIAKGDLNGDGITDLVVANQFSNDVSVLLGVGDGTFRAAVNYSAGFFPTGVVVADFNHDGHDDVAVSNELSGDVSVLINNGDGTLASAVSYAVGGQPLALTVGHFDAGTTLDLAVASADAGGGAGNVVILSGVGDGTFTTGDSFAVGVRPDAIVAAQFAGDSFTDLAVANRNSDQNGMTLGGGTVSVLRGNGDGSFQTAVNYAVGDQPTSLAVGDVNGDGKFDLAVANAATQDVSLLVGQAGGTFHAEQRIDLRGEPAASISGSFTSAVLLADFNGDGRLDLALANSLDPRVRVALGNGNGGFFAAPLVVVGGQPQALVAADFAGTGRIGFATAGGTSAAVSVRLGLGDGTFQVPQHFDVGNQPNGLVAVDSNHDGAVDLAVANDGKPGGTSILMGLGDGTFQPEARFASGISTSIASADLNGDGRPDLVTANYDPDTATGDLTVLLGLGDGTFQAPVHYGVGSFPIALLVADFNGDGHADVAVVNNFSNSVSILLGNGDGSLKPAVDYNVGSSPRAIALGHFNGDAHWDLAVANSGSNDVSILMGGANGTFQPAVNIPVGSSPVGIVTGDFGNGRIDIATVNSGSNDVSVLMNQAGGSFAGEVRFAAGAQPLAIAAGDFNGDGRLDLATANSGANSISVLAGLGGGAFAAPVSLAVGQSPTALIAADLNGDGRLDLACTNGADRTVTALLGRGDGTFVSADQFSANAIGSTPTLADVTGDGTADSIVLNRAGQILVRPGRANEPGAFDAARIVNPGRPARAFTIVESAGRRLIAAIDLRSDSASLYSIEANGVATLAGQLQTDLQPVRIAAADLNGDGRQDLVVANAGTANVSIFMATAAGGFAAATMQGATDHPTELTLVDLTGDMRPDIVLTDEVAGTVTVLMNQGAGDFAAPIHYRATTGQAGFDLNSTGAADLLSRDGAGSIVAGDFSENGTIDLVVVDRGDASLTFLEGDGRGGFLAPVRIVAGARPAIVRAGHFFPGGHLDLAVLDADNHTLTILRGDGHGGFVASGQYDAGNLPDGLSVGDFDRNGIADLVVGNQFGDVMALPGNGNGTFQPFTRVGHRIAIAVGDVTGNGQQSWLVTDQSRDRLVLQIGGTTPGFTQDRTDGVISPGAAKLADINGDGIADMIVANSGGNNVLVYLGLGLGEFAAPTSFYAGTNPVDVQVADVNGDGRPDVIVTNQGSNDVSILLGDPLALLRPGPRLDVGLAPVGTQLVPSTVPGGLPSLLVTNSGSNNVFMLPALGGGFFNDAAPTVFNTGLSPQTAIVGNFFGGAGLDLVTLNYLSNTLTVFRGFDPSARQDIGSGGLGPITAIAGDFAANGGLELVVGNNGNGSLAIFSATADGLIESDAIFSENLQHPIALALAAPGEGQELRLLAADEGDENVRVFSRESVLQPAKLADGELSSPGMPGFSFGVGGFSVLFGILGGLVESSAGELFVGLQGGTTAGGASMNFPSLRDLSVDQLTAVVSRGTKWVESAVGTILASAGVHTLPDAAVDVLESVLDAATPQVPWTALHHFFNSLLHTSARNQKGPPKPAVVDQTLDMTTVAPRIDAVVASLLFGDDESSIDGKSFDGSSELLADLADSMANRSGENTLPPGLSIRQRLFEMPANVDWNRFKDQAPPTASADGGPIGPARSESQSTERESLFAEWLLPGAIAAVLTSGPALFGGREPEHQTRPIDGFLNRKRRPIKFPGASHAQRD